MDDLQMKNVIIVHYAEIALKGKNRSFFEKILKNNIERALKNFKISIKKISTRFVIECDELNDKKEEIFQILKNVIGIAYFSYGISVDCNIDEIKKRTVEFLKEKNFNTFRISAVRSDKKFPLTSQKINEVIGRYVCENLNKKVSLENFDIEVFIEITDKKAFIYTEKIKGIGGLPVDDSKKVVALISGGIDSPVASFYAMKRGCKVVFVHFHSFPYTGIESIEKVKNIVKILNKFQFKSKIYLIPFLNIQREIFVKTVEFERYRIIIYRRFMLRIAEKICEYENAYAIVTGDDIGQVASQTLENIKTINSVCSFPVFRPLIGFDKEEIINKAKEIGTYQISILPHCDTCTIFMPKYPATKSNSKIIEKIEKNFDIDKMVEDAIKKAEIIEI